MPTLLQKLAEIDYARTPMTVAWEITRACALACHHCRADAQPIRVPGELSTEEGLKLIDDVAEMGSPVLVITGGDPLMRDDCFDLMVHAVARDLRVGFSPSATGRLTRKALEQTKKSGCDRLHLSLDGATVESHDRFRGVGGSYSRTLRSMTEARELELPLQVGTTVTRGNVEELAPIAELVAQSGAVMWSVFFLVPMGRALQDDMLDAAGHERVMRWLVELGRSSPFVIRTTAGMQFRRVAAQDAMRRGPAPVPVAGLVRAPKPVNDGDGFCFVSHTGDVHPSGFLPILAGNLREQPLAHIYRESSVFVALRDKSRLQGRCGQCEFRDSCGGSRARAWAMTGSIHAEDPSCAYTPRQRSEAVDA